MSKILFIEDEKALVDIYRDVFEKKGHEFITTFNIEKALEIAESKKPDVVLLDIIIPMPENVVAEQGYDFLRRVKINPKTKSIPIIIFSNLDTPQDRKKCKEMEAAAFMFKRDCTPKEVLDTVDEVIKRSKDKTREQPIKKVD
jgi:DNA-binding response OmpR family regulator